jgi:tetratricopeptide (TPR) repeat protein
VGRLCVLTPTLWLLPVLVAAQEPVPAPAPSRSPTPTPVPIAADAPTPPATAPAVPVGELVEGVVTAADPSQTYTLYLPPGYDPNSPADRRYPALLIFDARGRGTWAAELFRPGAERFGWILISSDNTASDGSVEPNVRAVNALLPELAKRWAADPRRIYAAGMSGTVLVAWDVALQTGALAGVVAASGPRSAQLFEGTEKVDFAQYGTVGTEDFNFTEMRFMDHLLARLGAPHRLVIFDGRHGWMPPEIATRALGWLEIQAMRQGRRPVDPERVRASFGEELDRARALEERGELVAALRSYRELVEGYEGLAAVSEDLADVRRKAEKLASRPDTEREEKQLARLEAGEMGTRRLLGEVSRDLRAAASARARPPTPEQLLERLEVRSLLETSKGEEGPAAQSARRRLAIISTQMSFYLRRLLWAQKAWREAATVLEVAATIQPERPELWYDLACARALDGHRKPALQALETAVDKGFSDVEHLESDPDLKALRGMDGYRALIEKLTSGRDEPFSHAP